MVCVLESEAHCIVRDKSSISEGGCTQGPYSIHVQGSTTVREFVQQVANHFSYSPESIELVLSLPSGDNVVFKESSDETLLSRGIRTGEFRNTFVIQSIDIRESRIKERNVPEEDLKLGASASPTTTGDYSSYQIPPPPSSQSSQEYPYTAGLIKQDTGYVGLVNQAMTCYLNSLLQALYMTPEFRNALYNWQYDTEANDNPSKCIPYQLQRLFLNLQTSRKTAVETTELTKSFGWDSSEAWQQHDIQELCRVMFDALEQVFKGTNQADLIDRLYQGKMLDYVKCLECSKEKSREDTFLDIPLPVRPFGSTVAYGSIEEALRAFVQPETLEGANQYFCESCAKKCDAHKGLKFTNFPYLLTLHLKRFDFDYNTLHRIKLNDKVVFPEQLDLNSFIEQEDGGMVVEKEEGSEGIPDELTMSKCDDSSTTDSGSALDDEGCPATTTNELTTAQDLNQDDDEGIDVSGGNGSNHHENEKNRFHGLSKGPYVYELFSIMIHSGSASGGHYYAYIKDFSSGEWFCFNDTSVTRITTDDIAKTFGGGAFRSYYSGAYSSSTNAYMLMYRQIAKNNCEAMRITDFPEHIKELYKEIQEKQENDRRFKERQAEMLKLKIYCQHPTKGLIDDKLFVFNDKSLYEATTTAFDLLKLEGVVTRSDCRLVTYNAAQESLEMSFDGHEKESLLEIMGATGVRLETLLLEIKSPEEEFETYELGSFAIKVYVVDLDKEEVLLPPVMTRTALSSTLEDLKASLASQVNINQSDIILVVEKYANDFKVLVDSSASIQSAGLYTSNKIFLSKGPLEEPFHCSKLLTIIDRFEHVITLHLSLPDTDPETLARMSIPSLSSIQVASAKQSGDSSSVSQDKVSAEPVVLNGKTCSAPRRLVLPLVLSGGAVVGAGDDESVGASSSSAGGGHSDQSTSEDSSLTDSDRTLIGDVQDECMSDGENQLSSPQEDEPTPLPPTEEESWDPPSSTQQYTYFKAFPYNTSDSKKMLKVHVDKRMSMETLKRYLETYVGVPASSFKLYRKQRVCDTLSDFKNEDTLNVKLGRQLSNDEQKIKVHQLVLNSAQPIKFLCEWIISKNGTVGQSKKEIIDDVNKTYGLNLQYDKCRLRRKNWKNVGRVFLDHTKWSDESSVCQNTDMFLQELPGPEPVKDPNQISLFVRQWHPSTLTLDPFDEVVLDGLAVDELKKKLSEKSNIPVENVEFAKPQGFFPCDMSVVIIQGELDWNPKVTSLEGWPLQYNEDGGVVFYRDSREEVKTLTPEERSELSSKENARLSSTTGTLSTYSPRKERPLKIYVDRRPCTNEADVD